MMRAADKLDSYRLLAAALGRLHREAPDRPWGLLVVGDGPARPDVEATLASLPPDRVRLLGALAPEALPPVYLGADLLVFPGIREALGLVYLEAAAAALPVVACRGPGPEVMTAPGGGVLTDPTADAFAAGLGSLLDDPDRRQRMAEAARRFVAAERSPEAFRRRLADGLERLGLP
jgi:glycosyltransferase involved in cell wall biosynthesis